MKMKKIFGVMLLGFMAVLLVACGQKSAEDIMKTDVDGVSIISAISYSDNIEKTVREMIEQF